MHDLLSDMPEMYIDGEAVSGWNICLESRPNIPSPKRKQTINESQYSDRGSYRNNTGWEDIQINVTFNYLEDIEDTGRSFRMAFSSIRKKLFDAKRIQFNDEIDVFYKVKQVEIGEAENTIIDYGLFTVTFTCNPFGYMNSEGDNIRFSLDTLDPNKAGQVIINGSLYESFPTITLYTTDATSQAFGIQMSKVDEQGNKISDTPDWTFKLRTTGSYTSQFIVDSERALLYLVQPAGDINNISHLVDMKDFPSMEPLTNYLIELLPTVVGARFDVIVERNQVI